MRALAVVALCLGCSSSDEVTRDRCVQLRDHLADLRLRDAVDGKQMPTVQTLPPVQVATRAGAKKLETQQLSIATVPIDVAAHRAALTQAMGENFLATCQQKISSNRLRCMVDAPDSAALAECTAPTRTASK